MKKIIVAGLFFLLATTKQSDAQVSVNLNINIGSQPVWGPVGYDYVEYYYLPDIEAYYYVPGQQFVFFSNGRWVFSAYLPAVYRNYNLYSGYKVVINQPRAYQYFNSHKIKYAGFKGKGNKQIVIRNSNDPKYYVVKGHPKHAHKSAGRKNNGNGRGRGHR